MCSVWLVRRFLGGAGLPGNSHLNVHHCDHRGDDYDYHDHRHDEHDDD